MKIADNSNINISTLDKSGFGFTDEAQPLHRKKPSEVEINLLSSAQKAEKPDISPYSV